MPFLHLQQCISAMLCRALLQNYKAKVAAKHYDSLRPRTMRERLDELASAVQRLGQGQAAPAASDARLEMQREHAFGGTSVEEEQENHRQRLERLTKSSSPATLAGIMLTDVHDCHALML